MQNNLSEKRFHAFRCVTLSGTFSQRKVLDHPHCIAHIHCDWLVCTQAGYAIIEAIFETEDAIKHFWFSAMLVSLSTLP
jgi:hypothetical protein